MLKVKGSMNPEPFFLAQDDDALSEKRVLGLLGLVCGWSGELKGFFWG